VALAHHWFYAVALSAQLLVLGAGVAGWSLHGRGFRALAKPYYFVLTNAASLVALYRYLRGDRVTVWKTIR
jgi:hypothetical protein